MNAPIYTRGLYYVYAGNLDQVTNITLVSDTASSSSLLGTIRWNAPENILNGINVLYRVIISVNDGVIVNKTTTDRSYDLTKEEFTTDPCVAIHCNITALSFNEEEVVVVQSPHSNSILYYHKSESIYGRVILFDCHYMYSSSNSWLYGTFKENYS